MQLTVLVGQFKLRSQVANTDLIIGKACGGEAQNDRQQGGSSDGSVIFRVMKGSVA